MKALITGVAGFAGLHLAEHLLDQGDRVLGCVRPGSDSQIDADSPAAGISTVAWDIRHPATTEVRDQIEAFQPEAIYHLAAISVPSACGKESPSPAAQQLNIDGVRSLVDLAAQLTGRPRLLFTSSCYVYSPVDPAQPVVHEESPADPACGYGKSKLAGERIVAEAASRGDVSAVIARVFQHTGPRQTGPMLAPEWSQQLLDTSLPEIRVQTADAYLDLSDVRDVVAAYRQLILHGRDGEIYNVGGGTPHRSGDILQALLALTGDQRMVVETSPFRRQNPIADIRKIQADTPWRPRIPLETTLRDTLAFWRDRIFG